MADSPQSPDDLYVKWSRYYGSSITKGFEEYLDKGTKFRCFSPAKTKFSHLFSDNPVYDREIRYSAERGKWVVSGQPPIKHSPFFRMVRRIFS